MREEEAEEAAARRNRDDPRRDRFVFYALDESAGLASDAWEVATRLRRDDDQPRRKSRVRAASIPPPATHAAATAVIEPQADPEPELAPEPEHAPTLTATWEAFGPTEAYDTVAEPADADVPAAAAAPAPRRRRFGLVRLWGVFVVLVGLAFIAGVLVVAIVFRDYTHLSTATWGVGVAAGLVAVWLGTALARRRR